MRRLKLLGLAALALFAFGALSASSAFAVEKEEEKNPRVLVLEGSAAGLAGTLTSTGAIALVPLQEGKRFFNATGATLKFENCEIIAGNEKDSNLCKNQNLEFTGVKEEKTTNCRSETTAGAKDPVETVLTLINSHQVAGLSTAKTLVPMLTNEMLGADNKELILSCGVLKIKIKGVQLCQMLPGLVNIPTTTNVEIVCKNNAETFDPENGECTVLCEDLGKLGLTETFASEPFDASFELTLKGTLNKDIFIDD